MYALELKMFKPQQTTTTINIARFNMIMLILIYK